jgi:hypothetical protein
LSTTKGTDFNEKGAKNDKRKLNVTNEQTKRARSFSFLFSSDFFLLPIPQLSNVRFRLFTSFFFFFLFFLCKSFLVGLVIFADLLATISDTLANPRREKEVSRGSKIKVSILKKLNLLDQDQTLSTQQYGAS